MARRDQTQLSFTDFEFQRQGIHLDPELQTISDFLDQHPELLDYVDADLTRGLKDPESGRKGLTASQVLRSLVLRRIKNWDLRELSDRIGDGYLLRLFTDFRGDEKVPNHEAFCRAFNRLSPESTRCINEAVLEAAIAMGLEDGNQLRVDTTVVQTDIHYPTDASLLWDAVRVVTRLVHQLFEALELKVAGFPDRTLAARRRMQALQRMTAKRRETQQVPKYRELVALTEEVVNAARAAADSTRNAPGVDQFRQAGTREIREKIEGFCKLGDRVLDQTRRRVFNGETVPPDEKVYSIFEDHTDMIIRGKARTPREFGHKLLLVESAHGLITYYEVLEGNPNDAQHVGPVLENHRGTFGHAPESFAGDRGFFSEPNLDTCKQEGVKNTCIPQRGGQKSPERAAYEKSEAFKRMQKFRAGIEGRISVLLRGRGMRRCLNHGRERFVSFVGSAVLTNNLLRIADLICTQSSKTKKAA